MSAAFFEQLDATIRTDPAGRGLLARQEDRTNWIRGHLAPSVRSLLDRGRDVAIVTGFAIPMADGPVAETDGPPGAVMLADVLTALGRRVTLVTDEICKPVVQKAAESAGLEDLKVEASPVEVTAAREWLREFPRNHPALTHLIAIERVGPCHSMETLTRQRRRGAAPIQEFAERVPPSHFGHCHNMRGEVIDGITAPLHQLFDLSLGPETIGIGDGGNEIGMGAIPWEEIASRLGGQQVALIPCSTATTWTILCGVSNWGGMALAAGIAQAANEPQLALKWSEDRQQTVLDKLVRHAGAVDGAVRRRQATVDGLSHEDYFRPWREIERLLTNQ
jgi:D-glutamate cyclase